MVIKVKYNGEWVKIPYLSDVHGEELVTEAPKDDKQYARQNGVWTVVNIPEVDFTEIYTALDTKVDKVKGKGLSTEDYLTLDKTKVNNLNEVLENAVLNTTSTGSTITLDKRNLVTGVLNNVELSIPVSTTDLAGLMLPADKIKLNSIAANAEVNVNADWNAVEGDAQILNKPTLATVATSGSYNDLTGKPILSTVATSGSYDDLSDKPDLTLIGITNEELINQDYQMALIGMMSDDNYVLTQEYYAMISQACPITGSIYNYSLNPSFSFEFGNGNIVMYKADDIINVVITTVGTDYETSNLQSIRAHLAISSDLSFVRKSASTSISPDLDNKRIIIGGGIFGAVSKDVSAELQLGGDGSKALMDDGKYRKLPVYGRNLLLGSGKEVSNSKYEMADYWLTEPISKGTQVTLTIFGELGDDKEMFTIYNSTGAVGSMAQFNKADFVNGKASKTFKWITNIGDAVADNTHIVVFSSPKTGTSTSTIHKIKLEYGDLSTEWVPAWEDIPDLEERYAYGVEWDTASSSPDGVRVGNMQLHRELPIQSKMRRCILDNNGGVVIYDTEKLEEGYSEITSFASMTRIPQHWYKMYFNGTRFRMMLSEIPLPGYKCVNEFYISTTEARLDRNFMILCSCYSVGSSSVNARGGDNTADWDNTYRSLLGRPVTNLTRDQFRQAARKRGSGWEMYTYNAHKTLFWLFAVEYATLNSQKPFNAQKDANGFSQGGLGVGPTQMTDWANFNNTNPLIPCGYTNEFGNGSGEKAYVVKNASGGTHATLMANRYRGIENPFGHIWKYTDGANIQVTTGDSGLSILWTTDDPSNFSDTSYTGYDKKGNICRTNGYAKKMLLREDGDIVATEVGGSSSTYWCDYYYTNTQDNRLQMMLVGGIADDGSKAGLAYANAYNAPSAANRYIGSRLCFFPKYKSTQITA